MDKKKCCGCSQELPIEFFHKNKRSADGYQVYCKQCRTEKYHSNIDVHKNYSRKNYQKYRGTPSYYLKHIQNNARKKNIEFDLDIEDIIIPEYCPLLGIKLDFNADAGGIAADNSTSADRIDSNKGYVKGNVWFISTKANRIKNNATLEELELLVDNLRKLRI